MIVTAEQLRLSYGSTVALAGVDAAVAAGEVLALVGPSGSGKSSLLYCLSRVIRADSGTVLFDGRDLIAMGDDEAAAVRRRSFGFVFQFAELVPELTIGENVALPLQLLRAGRRDITRRTSELLGLLDIEEVRAHRPSEVSGGQAQRAAVARAIAHRPQVIFADEPTGALDAANGQRVLDALTGLARDQGSSVVLVTHDTTVAAGADRRLSLRDGLIDQPVG